MRRAERVRAKKESRAPRALGEADFLLQVDDRARQGALRFSLAPQGPFLAEPGTASIPPLLHLSKLLRAAEHFENEDGESADELKLLLAPGSSLGGARPKASILDKGGALAIAKFPKPGDEYDIVGWEAVAFSLARNAGIEVPEWRLERVAKKNVLIVRRFDRIASKRIPFLSAMSLLGARDMEQRSYAEIGDVFRMQSADPKADLPALWRRMVFNILISNTDDHLRNHGFLFTGRQGWRLSPAYDMNPVPADIKPRVHATAIDEGVSDESLESALRIIKRFGLTLPEAKRIARETAKAVSKWRKVADGIGLGRASVERMESAFDHADLREGLKL
jgi:serine/threonine-protein kinase HipA